MKRLSLSLILLSTCAPTLAYVGVPSAERPTLSQASIEDLSPPAWRLALNFGREFATPLWDSYGSSGARFPVVVPSDFTPQGLVVPQSDTVSYTAVGGGVTKPIGGGEWKLVDENRLECSLYVPEELSKSDVVIPAGSTLVLEGMIHSQDSLKQIDEAITKARKEEWKVLEELDAVQVSGPKKWNKDAQRWERPRSKEPLTSLLSKNVAAFVKGQKRRQIQTSKPQNLSAKSGRFPGFDCRVFLGTNGLIKADNKVIGRWSAEPINDVIPTSYFGIR